ncbi:MAG: CPBP family intramembrane metalloprotease [Eubacteriaceae bacterium]|nr:CPBP family intramembrane metalloprotease [Eubacteriaceae bacterium]
MSSLKRLFAISLAAMLSLVFIMAPLQFFFGMYGLFATEVFMALLAFAFAKVYKLNIHETFPIKTPNFRYLLGTVLVYISTNLICIPITLIIAHYFPSPLEELSSTMLSLYESVPFAFTFLCVAVMPSICEEALFRGTMWQAMDGSNPLGRMLLIGLVFGIVHLDPIRFLPVALLGVFMCYVRYKTGSILYSMLLHLLNNGVSLLASFAASGDLSESPTIALTDFAVSIALALMGFFAFWLASKAFGKTPQTEIEIEPSQDE